MPTTRIKANQNAMQSKMGHSNAKEERDQYQRNPLHSKGYETSILPDNNTSKGKYR
jgi:hypothetical protein